MENDVSYQIDKISRANEVIEVEGISGFQHPQIDLQKVNEEDGDFEEEFEKDNNMSI